MTDEDKPAEFGLVLPFVCCKTHGGLLEDKSFVAGANFGRIYSELQDPECVYYSDYVIPEMVRQYDLIAMEQGFKMDAEPWDEKPDEWIRLTFSRIKNG